jgi:hypothetical protein
VKRRSKKLLEADKFRATVMALRLRTDVDWKLYEDNFIETQVRRLDDYIFSDDQRKVLNRLIAAATLFSSYSEYSVIELIKMAYPFRFEHSLLEDELFLEYHYKIGTTALSVRLVRYLASLYRRREPLQRDEEVEAVFRETWTEDTTLQDYEDVPYSGAA